MFLGSTNCPVLRCRIHDCCCCPPSELLFVLPGLQLLPLLQFPFLFALLLPCPFYCPLLLISFQIWCWLCIYCCGWNGILYVACGTRLVMDWHIICACFICFCNCVLVAVNLDIVVWLLLNAEEKSCTNCSYTASASMVAVSIALPLKPYCPAVTAQVRLRYTYSFQKTVSSVHVLFFSGLACHFS